MCALQQKKQNNFFVVVRELVRGEIYTCSYILILNSIYLKISSLSLEVNIFKTATSKQKGMRSAINRHVKSRNRVYIPEETG